MTDTLPIVERLKALPLSRTAADAAKAIEMLVEAAEANACVCLSPRRPIGCDDVCPHGMAREALEKVRAMR